MAHAPINAGQARFAAAIDEAAKRPVPVWPGMTALARKVEDRIWADMFRLVPAKPVSMFITDKLREAKRNTFDDRDGMDEYISEDATIHRHVHRGMSREQADRAMSNWRTIGGGQATRAYRCTVALMPKGFRKPWEQYDPSRRADHSVNVGREDRCYRVTKPNDRGSMAAVQEAVAHQDDPFAPKVYAVIPLLDGAWASEMELLTPLPDPYALEWSLCHLGLGDWFTFDFSGRAIPTTKALDASPFLRAVARRQSRLGAKWDLHGSNFMMRGKQLVILDPLWVPR